MTDKKPAEPITESQQPRSAKVDKLEVSIHSQQPTASKPAMQSPQATKKK